MTMVKLKGSLISPTTLFPIPHQLIIEFSARCYLITAIILLAVVVALIPVVIFVPSQIEKQIDDTVREQVLVTEAASRDPGHLVYPGWIDSAGKGSSPTEIHAYFFNVTNPEGVLEGEKPHVEEFGPYVWSCRRRKTDVKWTEDLYAEKIVQYKEWKSYEFMPEKSVGLETDSYTSANLIFQFWRQLDPTGTNLNAKFGGPTDTDQSIMFATQTAREWLFGWSPGTGLFFGDFPGLMGPPIESPTQITAGTVAVYTGESKLNNAFTLAQYDGAKVRSQNERNGKDNDVGYN